MTATTEKFEKERLQVQSMLKAKVQEAKKNLIEVENKTEPKETIRRQVIVSKVYQTNMVDGLLGMLLFSSGACFGLALAASRWI